MLAAEVTDNKRHLDHGKTHAELDWSRPWCEGDNEKSCEILLLDIW